MKKRTKDDARPTSVEQPRKEKSGLPAKMMFERDAGMGFENADRDSYAIPFLSVLQTNSPQCEEGDERSVKGAKAGMFLNTATGELYDGKAGVVLIPVHFQRSIVEWVPRDDGGGFVAAHKPEDLDTQSLEKNDKGQWINAKGNTLMDTRYHYCIHITPEGPRNVLFPLSSTQIKKSRAWMTKMSMLKLVGTGGEKFTPPTFSHAYRVTTVSEKNEKGTWKGVLIEVDHMLTQKEEPLYVAAKEFKKQIAAGSARVEHPASTVATDDGDGPF